VLERIIAKERPHLAVVDMDHDDSTALLARLGASNTVARSVTPVLGLTRRGDLKTKLRAFDLGVDDIVTVPFSPEELLARAIVVSRRATGTDRPIVPIIKLGEMEIDIVNRVVRAGESIIHLSGIEQSLLYLAREPRRPGRDPRRDHGRDLGNGFRGREQCRRSAHPEPPHQAPERLPAPSLHRDSGRQGLSIHPDVLERGLGRRVVRGRGQAKLTLVRRPRPGQGELAIPWEGAGGPRS